MGRLRQLMTMEQSETPKLLTDFTPDIQAIVNLLQLTYEKIKDSLPPEAKKEHWQRSKHDPSAWATVGELHNCKDKTELLAALIYSKNFIEAALSASRPVNLKLAKHRDR